MLNAITDRQCYFFTKTISSFRSKGLSYPNPVIISNRAFLSRWENSINTTRMSTFQIIE